MRDQKVMRVGMRNKEFILRGLMKFCFRKNFVNILSYRNVQNLRNANSIRLGNYVFVQRIFRKKRSRLLFFENFKVPAIVS